MLQIPDDDERLRQALESALGTSQGGRPTVHGPIEDVFGRAASESDQGRISDQMVDVFRRALKDLESGSSAPPPAPAPRPWHGIIYPGIVVGVLALGAGLGLGLMLGGGDESEPRQIAKTGSPPPAQAAGAPAAPGTTTTVTVTVTATQEAPAPSDVAPPSESGDSSEDEIIQPK